MWIAPGDDLWRLLIHEVTLFYLRLRLRKDPFYFLPILKLEKNAMSICYSISSRWCYLHLKLNEYSLVLAAVTVNFNNSGFLLLYFRYGENVTEADFNLKWTCPACREICNCTICRRRNGWMPTGNIYDKVSCTICHLYSSSLYLHYSWKTNCCLS